MGSISHWSFYLQDNWGHSQMCPWPCEPLGPGSVTLKPVLCLQLWTDPIESSLLLNIGCPACRLCHHCCSIVIVCLINHKFVATPTWLLLPCHPFEIGFTGIFNTKCLAIVNLCAPMHNCCEVVWHRQVSDLHSCSVWLCCNCLLFAGSLAFSCHIYCCACLSPCG